ncbi:MAG: hypothetical protein L0H26_02895 [Microlunatus sp.]|nr:hypothetical protein [Microlunatus sp.]
MRILVRANAHRPVLDDSGQVGVEVASSPDTPGRPDRWTWSIRLLDQPPSPTVAEPSGDDHLADVVRRDLDGPDGSGTLEVAVDPAVVAPEVDVLGFSEAGELERDPNDLVALLVTEGAADIEGRHLLRRLDTLVLEGDDPVRISIDPTGGPASVAVVRLRSTQAATVNWVP